MKTATAPLPPLRSVKVLDQLRERIRYLHYSLRTEQAYVNWVRASSSMHLIFLRIEMTPLAGRHPGFPGKHHRKIVTIFKATFGRNITD